MHAFCMLARLPLVPLFHLPPLRFLGGRASPSLPSLPSPPAPFPPATFPS
jgi:hypothetical protein